MDHRQSAGRALVILGILAFGSIAAVGIAAAVPEGRSAVSIGVATTPAAKPASAVESKAADAAAARAFEELRAGY